jgi:glycerol kinase
VPTYAFEGIIISSAGTLAWLRDQLGVIADFAEAEQLALAVPDNDGVYLVPAFAGLGLPHWRPEARAAIVGLSAHSDRRHVVRAALESIAYQLRDVLEAMRIEAAVPMRDLRGDGGPTVNRFLMQFTSDLLGVELRIAALSDGSALGAALAGLLGMRIYKSLAEVAAAPHDDMVYRPLMLADDAQRLYAGWQRAVRRVLADGDGPGRSTTP